MNHTAIRDEIRKRVVTAASITAVSELKLQGQDFDSSGKSFWVEEHLIGGSERAMTNLRNKVSSYLVQYDLCCPVGTSMDTLETKGALIETALMGASFTVGGTDCTVTQVKLTRTEGKLRNVLSVLLTTALQFTGS